MAACDILDVSAGQTVPDAKPVHGRQFQTPFSDRIRHEAGMPTMAVGNISSYMDVNTILAAGRTDLCVMARAHLWDPYWTRHGPTRWATSFPGRTHTAPLAATSRDSDELLISTSTMRLFASTVTRKRLYSTKASLTGRDAWRWIIEAVHLACRYLALSGFSDRWGSDAFWL